MSGPEVKSDCRTAPTRNVKRKQEICEPNPKKSKLIEINNGKECVKTLQALLTTGLNQGDLQFEELTIEYNGEESVDEILSQIFVKSEDLLPSDPNNGKDGEAEKAYGELLQRLKNVEGYTEEGWGKSIDFDTMSIQPCTEEQSREANERNFQEFLECPCSERDDPSSTIGNQDLQKNNAEPSSQRCEESGEDYSDQIYENPEELPGTSNFSFDPFNYDIHDIDINKLPDEMITSSFVLDYVLRDTPMPSTTSISTSKQKLDEKTDLVEHNEPLVNFAGSEGDACHLKGDETETANEMESESKTEDKHTVITQVEDVANGDEKNQQLSCELNLNPIAYPDVQNDLPDLDLATTTTEHTANDVDVPFPKKLSHPGKVEVEAKQCLLEPGASSVLVLKPAKVVLSKLSESEIEKYSRRKSVTDNDKQEQKQPDPVTVPSAANSIANPGGGIGNQKPNNMLREKLIRSLRMFKQSKGIIPADKSTPEKMSQDETASPAQIDKSPATATKSDQVNPDALIVPNLVTDTTEESASLHELENTATACSASQIQAKALLPPQDISETNVMVHNNRPADWKQKEKLLAGQEEEEDDLFQVVIRRRKHSSGQKQNGPNKLESLSTESLTAVPESSAPSKAIDKREGPAMLPTNVEVESHSSESSGASARSTRSRRNRKAIAKVEVDSKPVVSVVSSSIEGEKCADTSSKYPLRTQRKAPVKAEPKKTRPAQKVDYQKLMTDEMKKTDPDLQVLSEAMTHTVKARKKMVDDPNQDVAEIVKKYPALKNYQMVKEEYGRVQQEEDKMNKLETGLDIMLTEVLQLKPKRFAYRHPIQSEAKKKWLQNPNCDKKLKQVLGMISLCFHFVENDVEKNLCRLLEVDEELDQKELIRLVTPTLVLKKAEIFETEAEFWIYVETRKYLRVPNFYEGILSIYAIYYAFNLCYDEQLKSFFEFFDMINGNPQTTYNKAKGKLSQPK